MALGFQIDDYSTDQAAEEIESGLFARFDYTWTDQPLVDEICAAWGISRERFVKSMAAPKPGSVAHSIYNYELRKRGFEPLPKWPQGRGLIIPKWEGKEITEIKFHHLSGILKQRAK